MNKLTDDELLRLFGAVEPPMNELIPRKCLDGKTRMKPIQGYDCIHFHWERPCAEWNVSSRCDVIKDGYHHDCEHMKNPQRCEHFNRREKIR